MKRTQSVALRISLPVKKALIHIAEQDGRGEVSTVLLEAVLKYLADRGVELPRDCPEYRELESAEGGANAALAELMAKAVPVARRRSSGWGREHAVSRFGSVWAKLEAIDAPRLYNDAYEIFSDAKRTPRERIRAMEFRIESYERKTREIET